MLARFVNSQEIYLPNFNVVEVLTLFVRFSSYTTIHCLIDVLRLHLFSSENSLKLMATDDRYSM